MKQLLFLPKQSSLDVLGFDSALLRMSALVIAPSLTHIFNLSLYHSQIPSDWKVARVTPIYKGSGNKSDPNFYRPISVISSVPKLLEKEVKNQLANYLSDNSLVSPSQSAYLKYHSTQTALNHMVDHCLSNVNKGYINLVCTLDLSKGFDSLNHVILLKKLQKHGIVDHSLSWFKSYLSNRTQLVRIGNNLSKTKSLNMGVPQGTCLGPSLFLLYVNDFAINLESCMSISYADDTTLVSCGSDIDIVLNNMTLALSSAANWFNENKLVVNTNKSYFLTVASQYKLNNTPRNLSLLFESSSIARVSKIKLLGVTIDENLNFSEHVSQLISKISQKIALLNRLRHMLDIKTLNTVYLTIIQSLFDYCLTVWGNCPNVYRDQIQKLQNRAARAIFGNFDYTSSVSNMIHELRWMNINQRYQYFTLLLMYKCLNNQAPSYLSSQFNYVSSSTHNATNKNLLLPRPNTELFKRSFSYAGPKLWNDLPREIRLSSSLQQFKISLKDYILK